MKNSQRNTLLFLAIISSVFIFSCSKDRIETRSLNEYDASNTNNYLDSKKQDEQTFTIDSSGSGPIVGNQGTNIWLSKSCLMKIINGDSVSWPYTVKLVELYTPKDMIYYQMPTIASGTILKTDGEIRLRAFKDNDELMLRPSCTAQVLMPNTAAQNGMEVYYGTSPSAYWVNNPLSLGVTTFSTSSSGYTASVVKLGWINCGLAAGSSSNSNLSFTSTTDNLTNVAIFIYLPATKTVMQVYNLSSGSIPNGSSAKIICIGVKANGDLFAYNQNLTVNSSQSIDVTLTAITDANLTAVLDGL